MALPSNLIDAAMAAYRARLELAAVDMTDATNPKAFCEAERAIYGLTLELAAEMTRELLQQVSDDEDRRAEALAFVRQKAASRGIEMQTQRTRKTKIRTLSGQMIEVKTSYAVAKPRAGPSLKKRGSQGTGVYPVLDQLGISGRSTPALRLLVSRMVCEANSVKSARELLAASGVELGHKTTLRLTYSICDDALRARRRAMSALSTGNDEGEFVGRRVVATVDGGRVNIRRRVAGRPKKGGRKRFETEWREPKVITLYVLGEDGRRDRSVPSIIDGTLGDADAVFDLLLFHLRRVGAHRATELVFVADGAKWIWKRSGELREALGLPAERFQEIVDYYHAVERLGDFSKTQGWTDERRLEWLALQKRRLKAGNIEELEKVFRQIAKRDPGSIASELPYWERNRERLRYAAFRHQRKPVGSGAVESSVRRVINLRMKGASIFWTEEHAEGVLHLRAHAKSGRWSELEEQVLDTTGWRPTARQPRKAA